MREIKFRQWSSDRFHYWGCNADNFTSPLSNRLDIPSEQFIGLHDKNGKEIYEGDIVKFEDVPGYKDGCASVIWHEDSCGYYLENDDDNIYDTLYDFTPSYQIEIIGNIHENPELLEATC